MTTNEPKCPIVACHATHAHMHQPSERNVTHEMMMAFDEGHSRGLRCHGYVAAGTRGGLAAVLDLIADTAPTPDPRTDLAGYLGLAPNQVEYAKSIALVTPDTPLGKVGARLIEQDQARADEPDDGRYPLNGVTIEPYEGLWKLRGPNGVKITTVTPLNLTNAGIDLPAPKPPRKSPLADLPDLTEEQCVYLTRLAAGYSDDGNDSVLVLVGRALIAAGYTPREEA